jgi:hypothetical protein
MSELTIHQPSDAFVKHAISGMAAYDRFVQKSRN